MDTDVPENAHQIARPDAGFAVVARNALSHPIFPALLSLLAPLAGLWVAAHNDTIRDSVARAIPTATWVLGGASGDVWIFVLLLVILGAGFALHKWAEAAKNSANQKALEIGFRSRQEDLGQNIALLKESISVVATLGMDRVVDQFQTVVRHSYPAGTVAFAASPSKEELAASIRVVLGNLALFARELDVAPGKAEYSAIVLLFHSRDSVEAMTKDARDALLKNRAFEMHSLWDLPQLQGVLECSPELSTSGNAGNKHGMDPTTPQIVFPVPKVYKSSAGNGRTRYMVLPGAPYSAATGSYALFSSIRALEDWCEREADLTDALRGDISRYFADGPGSAIKSFITIPLTISEGEALKVVGVVAIQRSTLGILPGGRHLVFVPIVEPFLLFLSQLVARYVGARTQ